MPGLLRTRAQGHPNRREGRAHTVRMRGSSRPIAPHHPAGTGPTLTMWQTVCLLPPMPTRSAHACAQPGCGRLVRKGARCEAHEQAHQLRISREDRTVRGTASSRGYTSQWSAIRTRFMAVHPTCQRCAQAPAVECHHVVPLALGGTHDTGNLAALCYSCHRMVEGSRRPLRATA